MARHQEINVGDKHWVIRLGGNDQPVEIAEKAQNAAGKWEFKVRRLGSSGLPEGRKLKRGSGSLRKAGSPSPSRSFTPAQIAAGFGKSRNGTAPRARATPRTVAPKAVAPKAVAQKAASPRKPRRKKASTPPPELEFLEDDEVEEEEDFSELAPPVVQTSRPRKSKPRGSSMFETKKPESSSLGSLRGSFSAPARPKRKKPPAKRASSLSRRRRNIGDLPRDDLRRIVCEKVLDLNTGDPRRIGNVVAQAIADHNSRARMGMFR